MAKERFITRTIKTTEVIVLGMDTVTCEPFNEAVTLAGTYDNTEKAQKKMLADAKEKLLGNYIIGLETNLDKASNTGWYEASTRGYEFKDKYEKLINSVTDADIIEVANKYFTDNYILSIVTK